MCELTGNVRAEGKKQSHLHMLVHLKRQSAVFTSSLTPCVYSKIHEQYNTILVFVLQSAEKNIRIMLKDIIIMHFYFF